MSEPKEPRLVPCGNGIMLDLENGIMYDQDGCGPFGVVDRYTAIGIPHPDPETVCHGQCEGMGFVPTQFTKEEPWHTLWLNAELEKPSDGGWHFVKCPDCSGTGKKP